MDVNAANHQIETKDIFSSRRHEWIWDKELSTSSIQLLDNNVKVIFHPVYSIGTAVAKGSKVLEKGRHHLWEILVANEIFGTDVMIGVGTENVKVDSATETFCSLLGQDRDSWGYSFKGYVQHDGKMHEYGRIFGKGDLVGVHLDTWSGTLHFFLNRKPLGVAFRGLNNFTLYPLISCTMAQRTMELINSCSIPVSLQTSCLPVLTPSQRLYLSKTFPSLCQYAEIFIEMLPKCTDYNNEDDFEFPMDHIIVDDFDYALIGHRRKRKKL